MKLEEIIDTYGWNDWYDQRTGKIYMLSDSFVDDKGQTVVPVSLDGTIIWHCIVARKKGE